MEFFPKATEWLISKAGVITIDWNALAAKGQDSVRNTAYMDQYMLPAFNRAAKVIDSIDIQHGTTTEVLLNYYNLREKLSDQADELLQVAGTTVQLVNPLFSPTVAWSSYNNIVWYMWASALTGAEMHINAMIHKSGIPDADIAYHASLVTMLFNAIARMDDFGLLKPLKKSSTSGLGAVPLVAAIILGAVAIVMLAWAIVSIFEISQRNEVVKAVCAEAAKSGNPADIANCQKMFSTSEGEVAGLVPKAAMGIVEKIATMAMIGAGIYLMVQFGPGIATKLKQSVSAWKAA